MKLLDLKEYLSFRSCEWIRESIILRFNTSLEVRPGYMHMIHCDIKCVLYRIALRENDLVEILENIVLLEVLR